MLRWLSVLMVAVIGLGLSACAQAPTEAIQGAKAALEQARGVAAEYAPDSFRAAEDALNSATAEVQAQENKFALFRSYAETEKLVAAAKQAADKAMADGEAAKEQARKDSEALMAEAQTALDETKAALEKAPRGKGTRAEIEAMKSELDTLTNTLAEAKQAFDSGSYLNSKAKAQAVRDQARQIAADIEQARAKKR